MLPFGTAGIRGIMDEAASDPFNTALIKRATQGFADFINEQCEGKNKIVIAYDSRNNSERFAMDTAEVFAANGIEAVVFDGIKPTPLLSFAVRYLQCSGGVNITASHNPKEYNGYKAYWSDGAQLTEDMAKRVQEKIEESEKSGTLNSVDFERALIEGKITYAAPDVEEAYIEAVLATSVNPAALKNSSADFTVVYTPLHGTGRRIVPTVLRRAGLKNVYTVYEQTIPDGNFPTAAKPNPELDEVYELAVKRADEDGIRANLILATDPDADRIGVMTRDKTGKFVKFTGNQTGALLLDYILSSGVYKERGGKYVVKTFVTSEAAAGICAKYGVECVDVLTGFKNIADVIASRPENEYIFGFEESYGYLCGTYVRDKDAVSAALLIAEMAAYYHGQGVNLTDKLGEIYGGYSEDAYSEPFDTQAAMTAFMQRLRDNPPSDICGEKVVAVKDFHMPVDYLRDGKPLPGIYKSDVLIFETTSGSKIAVRPSGTEPKVKFYILSRGDAGTRGRGRFEKLRKLLL